MALTATPGGVEAAAGWKLYETKKLSVGIGAWFKNPWGNWSPFGGARIEGRF